jgi:hypothetical protein
MGGQWHQSDRQCGGYHSENTTIEPKMTDANLTTGDAGDGWNWKMEAG